MVGVLAVAAEQACLSQKRSTSMAKNSQVNKHGLSRKLPAEVRREVRKRSKFGCVIATCRLGCFYTYEHIDPTFENATRHDPDWMCLLCGSHQIAVTSGQISKAWVLDAYRKIQAQEISEASPPVGPLDFHDGSAELVIGGLFYSPAVQAVLRYNGVDLIRVVPGAEGEPGAITAVFTDDEGRELLWLDENAWVGSLENWDIEVSGQRITVRQKLRDISLQLRLDPPGRIVVEYLDMRFLDAHVLATDKTYAVGRYLTDGTVFWIHAGIRIRKSSPLGVAIEFTDPAAASFFSSNSVFSVRRVAVAGAAGADPDSGHPLQLLPQRLLPAENDLAPGMPGGEGGHPFVAEGGGHHLELAKAGQRLFREAPHRGPVGVDLHSDFRPASGARSATAVRWRSRCTSDPIPAAKLTAVTRACNPGRGDAQLLQRREGLSVSQPAAAQVQAAQLCSLLQVSGSMRGGRGTTTTCNRVGSRSTLPNQGCTTSVTSASPTLLLPRLTDRCFPSRLMRRR